MPPALLRHEQTGKTVPDFGPTWPEVHHGKEYSMEQKNTVSESSKTGQPVPAVKPLDKVKPPTPKSRAWERER